MTTHSRLLGWLAISALVLASLSCKLLAGSDTGDLPPQAASPVPGKTVSPVPTTPPASTEIAGGSSTGYYATVTPGFGLNQRFRPVGQIGGNTYAVAAQGDLAYIGIGPRLAVLDLAAPNAPALVGLSQPIPGVVRSIALQGGYAYVADGKMDVRVFDISNPANPNEIGMVGSFQWAMAVAIDGQRLYVADNAKGLWIASLENPARPRVLGSYTLKRAATAVAVQGKTAFVVHVDGGLVAIDVSDPLQPKLLGELELPQMSTAITLAGAAADAPVYAFIAAGQGGLWVVDVSQPAAMRKVAELPGTWTDGLILAGSMLYLTDNVMGLVVVDASNPLQPRQVGALPMMLMSQQVPGQRQLALQGGRLLMANPNQGLRVFDISQPATPRETGAYEAPLTGSAFDVVADGNTTPALGDQWVGGQAMVTRDFIGLGLVNMLDPTGLRYLGGEASFIHGGEFRTSWKLDFLGDFVFLADANLGLRLVNRSNPASLSEISRLELPGSTRSVILRPRVNPPDWLAFVTTYEHDPKEGDPEDRRSLRIIDYTQPAAPREIGRLKMQRNAMAMAFLEPYLLYPDTLEIKELSQGATSALHVIDISDPTRPTEIANLDTTGRCSSVTAIATYRGYAYLSGEQMHGLCIIDLTDPTRPKFAGYFDDTNYILDLAFSAGADGNSPTLFGAAYAQVVAIDLSDPARPRLADVTITPGLAWGIYAAGSTVYVADMDGGLNVLEYK